MASSSTGRKLQVEELQKKIKGVFGTLLAVGILTLIVGLITGFGAMSANPGLGKMLIGINAALAAAYIGLAVWSRKSPLPPAIIGLSIFVAIHALNAIADPATIPQGLIMKVIVISVLVRAIIGALQCRKIERMLAAENG